MKKSTKIIFLFLALQLIRPVYGQVPLACPVDESSLSIFDSSYFEKLSTSVLMSVCNEQSVYSDVKNTDVNFEHNRLRCGEVEICHAGVTDEAELKNAEEILKETIPNAALISLLREEIGKSIEYNILGNRFDEIKKPSFCASEKIDFDCDASLRKAINSVGRDYFMSSQDLGTPQLKVEKGGTVTCSSKLSLSKICKMSQERVKSIAECEKNKSKGCLDKEQKALATLVNSHRDNKSLFLEIEKQLCTPSRMVQSASQLGLNAESGVLGFKAQGHYGFSTVPGFGLNAPLVSRFRFLDENANLNFSGSEKSESEASSGPSDAEVIRAGALKVEVNAPRPSEPEVIKDFESRDGSKLSEQFSESFNKITQKDNSTINTNDVTANGTWTNEFSNRFNSIAEEQKRKKEEEEEKKRVELSVQGESSKESLEDKKKKDEMSALVAQINSLKEKLDDMNANVESLKSKKGHSNGDQEKLDKDALEREKSVLDLKKKLAELEAYKKKMQAESIAKAAEDEKSRIKEEARKVSVSTIAPSFSNREFDKAEPRKVDYDASASSFNQSGSFSASRGPASVGSSPGASTAGTSTLVLKSAGAQASSESAIVYMTAVELQKYPYHLNDNASSGEIEKMILGNNGATIILGNSEQIIPITEKGVVQLDKDGRVKYKRVKISLVKNERERKQNIAREISSVADLKREDQRKRDLIRYQEMKKAIKKATDRK